MLFTSNPSARNSLRNPKERNLYYKIFSGYIFNEFIDPPSLPGRVKAFLEIIPKYINFKENKKTSIIELMRLEKVDVELSAVSFDNHLIKQKDGTEFPGEYADIAVWLNGDQLIAIEAKYTADWNATKDIKGNVARIQGLLDEMYEEHPLIDYGIDQALFVLLVLDEKLKISEKRSDSVLKSLSGEYKQKGDVKTCIITWDQVIAVAEEAGDHTAYGIIGKYLRNSKWEIKKLKSQKGDE